MYDGKVFPMYPPEEEKGAIPELAGVIGAELLEEVSHRAQRAWIRVHGIEMLREQLPAIFCHWETAEIRRTTGRLPLFIVRWLENARKRKVKEEVRKGKPTLKVSEKECVPSKDFPNICLAHKSNETCALEGRC